MSSDAGRIAYLCQVHPWVTQTFVFDEIRNLRAHGVPLDVLAFKRPRVEGLEPLSDDIRAAIETTRYLPTPWSAPGMAAQARALLARPWRWASTLWTVATGPFLRAPTARLRRQAFVAFLRGAALRDALLRGGYAHVHADFATETATAAWTAWRLGGPPFSFRDYASFDAQLVARKVAGARFVLACSAHDRRRLLDVAGRAFADKVHVDVLGVDLRAFLPDESVAEASDLVLCVGTLQPKKGQAFLLEAAARLVREGCAIRVHLVGDGRDRASLETLAEGLGIASIVTIDGYVSRAEVRDLMRRAAVTCLPSIVADDGDVDGIPFVLMEAMALGRACVSTTVSGIPELIVDGVEGCLVPPRDAAALAGALNRLLGDARLRRTLGAAARRKVEASFDVRENTRRTAALFLAAGRLTLSE